MTTVAAKLYHHGKVIETIDVSKPIPHVGKRDFIWIGLHEPNDGTLKRIQDHFGLHPLAVEYGYYLIVGVMATICLSLYIRFKRAGWL